MGSALLILRVTYSYPERECQLNGVEANLHARFETVN